MARVSKHEVHEPSIPDGESSISKEVWNHSRMLNFFSIKVAIHLGPNYLANFGGLQEHELRGNSELFQYHTEIDIRAF